MSNIGTKYSLQIRNLSGIDENTVVYQKHPNMDKLKGEALPTAWLAQKVSDNARVLNEFNWEVKYGLSWSDKAALKNGVTYHGVVSPPYTVNLGSSSKNSMTMTYKNDLFRSEVINDKSISDKFRIKTDTSYTVQDVKSNSLTVALHMDGKPVTVMEAMPNNNFDLTPLPTYYIGTFDHVEGEMVRANIWSDLTKIEFDGATTMCCVIDNTRSFNCETTLGDCNNFFESQGFTGDL